MTALAISAEHLVGWVLVLIFGPPAVVVVVCGPWLWCRTWRAYREPRPPRWGRTPRRRRGHAEDLYTGALADQYTDRFDTDSWESKPR